MGSLDALSRGGTRTRFIYGGLLAGPREKNLTQTYDAQRGGELPKARVLWVGSPPQKKHKKITTLFSSTGCYVYAGMMYVVTCNTDQAPRLRTSVVAYNSMEDAVCHTAKEGSFFLHQALVRSLDALLWGHDCTSLFGGGLSAE